jgi:antitoxin (DNA-binding transcriptional repressor) of toxin-antitoxin stability system
VVKHFAGFGHEQNSFIFAVGKSRLAPEWNARHLSRMKTASVQQLPQQWPEILRWVAAGEEVQVTQQDKVIARVVPAEAAPQPDFLARAKAVWGEQPPGKPLSEVVSEARGGEA